MKKVSGLGRGSTNVSPGRAPLKTRSHYDGTIWQKHGLYVYRDRFLWVRLILCEEELIRRTQAGDWGAFERIVERYRTVLTRTAYLMTRDRESVQDVMQEALVQVWRDLPAYRPIGSFQSWMLKILINKARKHYRRKRVPTVALESATEVPDYSEGLEETIERGRGTPVEAGSGASLGGSSGDPGSAVLQRAYSAGDCEGARLSARHR